MASKNKKKKAKNSFINGGAEAQKDIKCKRVWYYTKADRQKNKKECFSQINQYFSTLWILEKNEYNKHSA